VFRWFTLHNSIIIHGTTSIKINVSDFEVSVNKAYTIVVQLLPGLELEIEGHFRGRQTK